MKITLTSEQLNQVEKKTTLPKNYRKMSNDLIVIPLHSMSQKGLNDLLAVFLTLEFMISLSRKLERKKDTIIIMKNKQSHSFLVGAVTFSLIYTMEFPDFH